MKRTEDGGRKTGFYPATVLTMFLKCLQI